MWEPRRAPTRAGGDLTAAAMGKHPPRAPQPTRGSPSGREGCRFAASIFLTPAALVLLPGSLRRLYGRSVEHKPAARASSAETFDPRSLRSLNSARNSLHPLPYGLLLHSSS
ncbi:hypothetical protein ACFPRL_34360 [Pseudoclavibacter helvolus]